VFLVLLKKPAALQSVFVSFMVIKQLVNQLVSRTANTV
jgi:hypothetical protein